MSAPYFLTCLEFSNPPIQFEMAKNKSKKVHKKIKSAAPTTQTNSSDRMLPIGVLVITALVFLNCLQNGFVNWDDPVNILENPNLNGFTFENIKGIFTSTVIGNYNPLSIFTFAVEKALFGLNPVVFHFNNLLLHLVCVFLVYRFLLSLKLSPMAAAFGALLFGIHPMRVESVAWITERKDVLFGAFYLGALLTYVKSLNQPKERTKWLAWTMGLFVLSCLSKIQAVSLPLSMLAIDYYFNRDLKFKLVIEKIPFFAVSLLTGLAGIYFLGADGSLDDQTNYTFVERLLTGAYTYCVYLIKWLIPYEMSPLYPYESEIPTLAYVAPVGVLLVGGLFYWAFKSSNKALVFAIAFFTFNVMFMLQIVGAGQGFLADRFTYIPYLGLFFLMAYYLDHFLKRNPSKKSIALGGLGLYLAVLGFASFQQNKIWKNGETLWSHASACYPKTHTPYQNRGKYYQSIGKKDLALSDFNKSIETAKDKDIPYNSRGKIYFDRGQVDLAFADFDNAVKSGTTEGEIYVNRGSAHAQSGRMDAALADFNKGVELDPEFKNGYLMRSFLFMNKGDFAKAALDLKRVVELSPNDAKSRFEYGMSLNRIANYQEALTQLNYAIKLSPRNGSYYAERANAHNGLGDSAKAAQDRQTANSYGG